MNDPTRLRIDIDVNEDNHALTIEVWAMVERSDDGSTWRKVVRQVVPVPKVVADVPAPL